MSEKVNQDMESLAKVALQTQKVVREEIEEANHHGTKLDFFCILVLITCSFVNFFARNLPIDQAWFCFDFFLWFKYLFLLGYLILKIKTSNWLLKLLASLYFVVEALACHLYFSNGG
ncbi:hypothetical protein [Prochlorococcus sp. ALOHA_ZT_50]|jgi:pilus assembly protein TadC|uniref:hypothetical protein n=1 Tax=Prochlorococcus sp. ALOHA_ZT_50 TaxID=2919303 RepID=UPI00257DCDEB|nr:hypothetical protein [Prochlorococcus sp. ALOHA_ZT_50]MCH2079642.1 hypothetical protein [Prochlorococcus sp. ALOHA_ZT_50]